jgi:ubiquinone/menaquinone biosynthesis C-methylase UbiE/uncharacterized protein YbaR (Trm112 family)
MNQDLLATLVCPSCKGELQLVAFANNNGATARTEKANQLAEVGILKCRCGEAYPLIDGVPRLVEHGMASFPTFVKEYREQIRSICGDALLAKVSAPRTQKEDEYSNIRRSFSQEWSVFDYEHDKTWGWSLAERKQVFLGDMQLTPEQLAGKRMLDAGCGNGTLSAALTDFGLDIVGLDLNDGLGLAHRNRTKYGNAAGERVRYVQGNLVEPPFKEGSYDLVYSSGVIHHTPSSSHSFASLTRMVKPGGRLYVWVYRKRAWPIRLFFAGGRSLKQVVPLQAVMAFCRALAPVYKVGAVTLNGLNVAKFRSRTTREITLDLFDALAPRYNHWHTEAEVRSWFEQHGFHNINASGAQKHGFGMHGDKK